MTKQTMPDPTDASDQPCPACNAEARLRRVADSRGDFWQCADVEAHQWFAIFNAQPGGVVKGGVGLYFALRDSDTGKIMKKSDA